MEVMSNIPNVLEELYPEGVKDDHKSAEFMGVNY